VETAEELLFYSEKWTWQNSSVVLVL